MTTARPWLAAAITAAMLTLAACGSGADPDPTPDATAAPPPAPSPTTAPSEQPEPEPEQPAELTCESIIPTAVVDEFEAAGWTFREDIIRIGAVEVADSVHCVWGDFSTANDLVVVFASGLISPADAQIAQEELRGSGWIFEDGDDGTVYVTEDPAHGLFTEDEDGYGMTYLFGDGWLTFADTKQGLLLVTPPAI